MIVLVLWTMGFYWLIQSWSTDLYSTVLFLAVRKSDISGNTCLILYYAKFPFAVLMKISDLVKPPSFARQICTWAPVSNIKPVAITSGKIPDPLAKFSWLPSEVQKSYSCFLLENNFKIIISNNNFQTHSNFFLEPYQHHLEKCLISLRWHYEKSNTRAFSDWSTSTAWLLGKNLKQSSCGVHLTISS